MRAKAKAKAKAKVWPHERPQEGGLHEVEGEVVPIRRGNKLFVSGLHLFPERKLRADTSFGSGSKAEIIRTTGNKIQHSTRGRSSRTRRIREMIGLKAPRGVGGVRRACFAVTAFINGSGIKT